MALRSRTSQQHDPNHCRCRRRCNGFVSFAPAGLSISTPIAPRPRPPTGCWSASAGSSGVDSAIVGGSYPDSISLGSGRSPASSSGRRSAATRANRVGAQQVPCCRAGGLPGVSRLDGGSNEFCFAAFVAGVVVWMLLCFSLGLFYRISADERRARPAHASLLKLNHPRRARYPGSGRALPRRSRRRRIQSGP